MQSRLLVAASLLAISGSATAGGVAFQFGDDTFGVSVAGELSPESSVQLDWLHHEDGADMVALGAFANGQRGSLTGRAGVKAIGLDGDDADVDGGALAFGGDLSLPLNDILRLRTGLYYAPDITGFGDIDGYTEWSVSAEFAIFQNSALQIGYAEYEFDSDESGKFEFEDGVFIRLQLRL